MNQVGYLLTSKYLRQYGARNNSAAAPCVKTSRAGDQLNTGTCEKT